eukprot:15469112-Alexandrium_andersonii.AAC.1
MPRRRADPSDRRTLPTLLPRRRAPGHRRTPQARGRRGQAGPGARGSLTLAAVALVSALSALANASFVGGARAARLTMANVDSGCPQLGCRSGGSREALGKL